MARDGDEAWLAVPVPVLRADLVAGSVLRGALPVLGSDAGSRSHAGDVLLVATALACRLTSAYGERMTTMEKAPDIGPNYPSRGARLGPAWQRTWDALADGEWHAAAKVAEDVAGDCSRITVMNLLGLAAKAGLVEREMRADGKPVKRRFGSRPVMARTVWYRRVEQ